MGAADEGLVLFEKQGPVAILTLNRPAVHNAINLAMRDELWTFLQAVRDDPDVRSLLIRGAGERAFCAGADVTEFGSAPSVVEARRARRERDLWWLMASMPKPVVAALHGWALGAGCELSLYCDLRIAADNTRLGLPEVGLGYIPSAGGTQTLPRTVPPGMALAMILTGEPVDALTAERTGLVHRVVSRDRLDAMAMAVARDVAALPPHYARAVKETVQAAVDLPAAEALSWERRLSLRLLSDR